MPHYVTELITRILGHRNLAIMLELCITGTYAWQDLYDVLNDAAFKNIPGKETYGAGKTKASTPTFSNAKSLKIFPDFTYHTLSETVKEMGNDLVASGLL